MPRRGLRERVVYACNPFPAAPAGARWTQRYFAELAGLRALREAASVESVFFCKWMYGQGAESELVTLAEGELHELRESEARDFMREKQELGFVLIDEPGDADHVTERKLEGVSRALEFYGNGMRGRDKLIELQGIHSYTDLQMSQQMRTHWIYHVNAQIETFLQGYLDSGAARDFGAKWLESSKRKPASKNAA